MQPIVQEGCKNQCKLGYKVTINKVNIKEIWQEFSL